MGRHVYVISDLHLGGRYAEPGERGGRGFRMCPAESVDALVRFVGGLRREREEGAEVELVINGDFVDFLAEESKGDEPFRPFLADESEAVRVFEDSILARDRRFFDALADFLAAGGELTVLLGNHDVELSFPLVRRSLRAALRCDGASRLRFIYDNEAYVVGDAIIEHGNRYDGFNTVDHDALRRTRSCMSRRQDLDPKDAFAAPAGSRLVAEIMNPIKKEYPFVDLLKPETAGAVPVLMALEPRFRSHGLRLLRLYADARKHNPVAPGVPAVAGDMAAMAPADGGFGGDMGAVPLDEDIADGGGGLFRLFAARGADGVESRLPALLDALEGLRRDRSFDLGVEEATAYQEAAEAHVAAGFRFVLFGHTHLAKDIALPRGGRYLNTGTWADVMTFPEELRRGGDPRAKEVLRGFIEDLLELRYAKWIKPRRTYARLRIEGERVVEAGLEVFEG